MSSTRSAHKARARDKVYDYERVRREQQANGEIRWVDFENKTIGVKFHDNTELEEIDFERFEYGWSEDFGGIWYLY